MRKSRAVHPVAKRRVCHWCKAVRYSGWWIRPSGYARFHPCCSAGMCEHLLARLTYDVDVRTFLKSEHVVQRVDEV